MMAWHLNNDGGVADFYYPDSWVEIASQPSSSSLSSAADITDETGQARPQSKHNQNSTQRRHLRRGTPSNLNVTHRPSSVGGTSSQEECEESESESDRVMTSSGEGGTFLPARLARRKETITAPSDNVIAHASEDDDDENRTAINYPINNDQCFTPQPNAFSHPPGGQTRYTTHPEIESYFPSQRPRPATRQSLPAVQYEMRSSHMPQNVLSPSHNAAAQHEEALRASLSTLLSCAAAARGLPRSTKERTATSAAHPPPRANRIEPLSLRLVPESALPARQSPPQFHEPTFKPTIRRESTSTSASSGQQEQQLKDPKRKTLPHSGRGSSRDRARARKTSRRSTGANDELTVTPTLFTWIVSAGVVMFLSALSFSAGYSLGKEAGARFEAVGGGDGSLLGGGGSVGAGGMDGEPICSCAREAGRSGLGLKRSLARRVVQV